MKNTKKWLVLVLAGMLAACAVVLSTGCFGIGGSGSKTPTVPDTPSTTPSAPDTPSTPSTPSTPAPATSDNPKEGRWQLSYATDTSGKAYDLSQSVMESVVLEISGSKGTFYYMDRDPFSGTLERYSDRDSYYASDGYKVEAYKLMGESSYWEFAFITPKDGGDAFWYLEIGSSGNEDCLFLSKVGSSGSGSGSGSGGSGSGTKPSATDAKVGTWTLSYATEADGSEIKLSDATKQSVKLVVSADGSAVFYYLDDEPFHGTLVRYSDRDSHYASTNYDVQAYKLSSGDGSYWEFAFVQAKDGSSSFWYLEIGKDSVQSLFLSK